MIDKAEQPVVNEGFHQRVYELVRRIPKGSVSTYGRIATLLGSPRVARHVGWALSALPGTASDVPWHRVVNAQGRISLKGHPFLALEQRTRLEQEGIAFDRFDRIDLQRYGWPQVNLDGGVGL